MKIMVIVKATKNSESGALPSGKMLAEMGKFNEELVKAGVMEACDGLQRSAAGKRVKFSGSKRVVSDGPFGNVEDLIAGYWVWNVKSMDEALAWAKRCPDPSPGEEGVLELRPVAEMEEFAESDPTGRLREQDAKLRRSLEKARKP